MDIMDSHHVESGALNDYVPNLLRQRAANVAPYTGNHMGKSMPNPIEPDLSTHAQNIPDRNVSTGTAIDHKNTGLSPTMMSILGIEMTVRWVLIGGAIFILWKSANMT